MLIPHDVLRYEKIIILLVLLAYNLYIILTAKYAPSQTAMESFITYLEPDLAVLHKLIL